MVLYITPCTYNQIVSSLFGGRKLVLLGGGKFCTIQGTTGKQQDLQVEGTNPESE